MISSTTTTAATSKRRIEKAVSQPIRLKYPVILNRDTISPGPLSQRRVAKLKSSADPARKLDTDKRSSSLTANFRNPTMTPSIMHNLVTDRNPTDLWNGHSPARLHVDVQVSHFVDEPARE